MDKTNILSINFNHDGSAVIISDGKISGFVNTERFSKIKKHPGIRKDDLGDLLGQAGIRLTDIGIVLLCNIHDMDSPDIPFLYGSSLKETWFEFWVNQTMNMVEIDGVQIPCLVNPDHHLLHCSLAYYTSPFQEAICFSWDPTGYGAFIGLGNKMVRIPISLSGFNSCRWYNHVAASLFDTGIFGAGKVMGLAPYGLPEEDRGNSLYEVDNINELYALSERGKPIYLANRNKNLNASLAFNIQKIMEHQLSTVLDELYRIAGERGIAANLCLGGGAALNSVANQLAFAGSNFVDLHIHPASGDDGTAIGAGLWYWFDQLDHPKRAFSNREMMYSVKDYDNCVREVLELPEYREHLKVSHSKRYIEETAEYLAEGKIIGWFQGASEIGPRALGNRSILADPRSYEMKDILNLRVKFREDFRPFAPSVLNEHAEEWFGLKDSPFMLRVCNVLKPSVPAITHVDNSARIQTVSMADNVNYYKLIGAFYELTGIPVILNTSFNIKGEPIVETPKDAIESFLRSNIDVLVFKELIVQKSGRP